MSASQDQAASNGETQTLEVNGFLGLFEGMIQLIVGEGEDQHTFEVHKNILTKSSPFFETACKPEWMKLEERVIKLPEAEPLIIQSMIYWMYNNRVCIPKDLLTSTTENRAKDRKLCPSLFLVKLYCIGDMYQIEGLKNDAIDGLIQVKDKDAPTIEALKYAYENTPENSDLRTFFVLNTVYHSTYSNIVDLGADYPKEFLFRLVRYFFMFKNGAGTFLAHPRDPRDTFCQYFHNHNSGLKRKRRCTEPKPLDTFAPKHKHNRSVTTRGGR